MSECLLTTMESAIHQHTDGWYFCDEVWCDCIGPYLTEEVAIEQLKEYCEKVLGV